MITGMTLAANALSLFSLAGRSAEVTGAAGGIGRAIALGLARPAPTSVAWTARGKGWPIRLRPSPIGSQWSLGSRGRHRRAATGWRMSQLENTLGPVTIAMNCAGVASAAPAEELSLTEWDRVIGINPTGVFLSSASSAGDRVLNDLTGSGFARSARFESGSAGG